MAAVGAAVVQAAPALGTAEWLAEFQLSPGPAVLAAVLGLVAARARIRADRAVAEDARRGSERAAAVARSEQVDDRDLAQWWAVYRWVVERDHQLGPASTADVLAALGDAADDAVRSALVSLALERGRTSEERCDDD